MARALNWGVLGMDFAGLFYNMAKAPVMAVVQPPAALVYAGASAANSILHLTDLGSPEAVTRRKLSHVLPKVIKHTPTPLDLAKTILKIAKYALGFFSSLTLGFIFVTANIWVHHKLGLICNPAFAKKDRKKQIIEEAQKKEESSLKIAHKEKCKEKFEKRVEEKLREDIFGHNRKIYHDEVVGDKKQRRLYFDLDQNSLVRDAMDRAVNEKREKSKAEEEGKLGRELTQDEFDQIKAHYWKQLSDPFTFAIDDKLSKSDEEFLSTYFNWRSEKKPYEYKSQPFAFKSKEHCNAYLTEYYKWNFICRDPKKPNEMTQEEAKVMAAIAIDKDRETAIFAEAENELAIAKRKMHRKTIETENECAELDSRVTDALQAQKEELNRSLSAKETAVISNKIKAIFKAEKAIIEKARKIGQCPEPAEVKVIMNTLRYKLTADEEADLQNFALTAMDVIAQKQKNLQRAAKKRPAIMPTAHYYELKNMVVRQLKREFAGSKFDRPAYDLQTNVNIDQEILERVKARTVLTIAKLQQPLNEPVSDEIKKQLEEPHLYQQFFEEKRFPAVIDRRKFKKKDRVERAVRFEALTVAREKALKETLENYYEKDEAGKFGPKVELNEQAYRKDNEENDPIPKERNVLPNKEWAQVVVKVCRKQLCQIADDDEENETKIFFYGKQRIKNDNGIYVDGEESYKSFTFDQLDEVEVRKKPWILNPNTQKPVLNRQGHQSKTIQRIDVFKEAAKKYKAHKYEIAEHYFGQNGVEEQVDLKRKKLIKSQWKDHTHWEAFGNLDQLVIDQKKEIVELNGLLRQQQQELEALKAPTVTKSAAPALPAKTQVETKKVEAEAQAQPEAKKQEASVPQVQSPVQPEAKVEVKKQDDATQQDPVQPEAKTEVKEFLLGPNGELVPKKQDDAVQEGQPQQEKPLEGKTASADTQEQPQPTQSDDMTTNKKD